MARQLKNFKIELNSTDNLRDLLQQIMDLADEQLIQAQNEINKLESSTDLVNEPMDGRSKYAKAINDYLGMKDKAMAKKIDVAKMLNEIINHNGDVTPDAETSVNTTFNINNLRSMIDDTIAKKDSTVGKTLTLKKP